MATVSELKDQARVFEQKGALERAVQIYRHILRHLSDQPAHPNILPLHVKVGDLSLKLGRAEDAVAAYEAAARGYAMLGAAQRVTALCAKILRVAPQRSGIQLEFGKQLLAAGHAGSARDVLAEYAEEARLAEAAQALDDLAGRPTAEMRPLLERLIRSIEAGGAVEAAEAARRVSSHMQQAVDDAVGELEDTPTSGPEPVGEAGADAERFEPRPPPRPAAAPTFTRAAPEEPSRPPAAHAPKPAAPGPGSARRVAIGFGAGVLVGIGLAAVGLVPGVGGDSGAGNAESASTDAAFVAETVPRSQGESAGLGSTALPEVPPPDSAALPPMDTTPQPAVDRGAPASGVETSAAPEPGVPAAGDGPMPIIIDGVDVESVDEIEYRGEPGFRVVQLLGGETPFTIESFPVPPGAPGPATVGRLVVSVTPPDTVVGVMRLETHMVYASAVIPEDSLRALMSRLVVAPRRP